MSKPLDSVRPGHAITLYLGGCLGVVVGGIDLSISNLGPTNSPHEWINDGVLLSITGTWATASSDCLNLAVPYTYNTKAKGVGLNITGVTSSLNTYLPLFMQNITLEGVENLPLFIENWGAEAYINLWIRGTGLFSGYYPDANAMLLFLQRRNYAAAVQPLRLKAYDAGANCYLYLILEADVQASAGLPLTIRGSYPWSGAPNSYLGLYLEADGQLEQGMQLHMRNNLTTHNHALLVLHNHFGFPNSYLKLYLESTGTPLTGTLDLAIPYTKEAKNSGLKLYTHGY